MAEVDAQAYAVTSGNAAAVASNSVETQQPGATGALRQVMVMGDPTTRANMQTVKSASTAAASTDLPAVVALHPSSPTPAGTNLVGKVGIDQTTLGTTNNVSVSASTGAGTSALVKDDTAFGDAVTTGIQSSSSRLYNGTSYDRWRGDTTAGAWVQLKAALPAGTNLLGKVSIDQTTPGTTNLVALAANQSVNNTQLNGVALLAGNGITGTGSQRVTIASDNTTNTNPWLVTEQKAATSTLTSVTAAITSTTCLAANTARKGAYFFNDSTSLLYLAFAATASATAHTVQIPAGGFYEMPEKPLYTGLITGIWVAANGALRVTELT